MLFFRSSVDEWDSTQSIPPAYLSGYEHARADNPLESTEAPSAQRTSQMYRHPLSIGHGRVSFTKVFDLYSLGCVLLELGFWAPLQTILLHHLRRDTVRVAELTGNGAFTSILEPRNDAEYYSMDSEKQRLLHETGPRTINADLQYRMGTCYSQIVMRCLHASESQEGEDEEEFDQSIAIQEESLTTLKQLAAVI